MAESAQIPTFPVPDFSEVEAVFGAGQKFYLTEDAMGREFYAGRHPMCRIASTLFFKGGKLADHGLRFRSGVDRLKAMRAIRALLCSFEPKHEIKIGTVGVALANWCEPVQPEAARV